MQPHLMVQGFLTNRDGIKLSMPGARTVSSMNAEFWVAVVAVLISAVALVRGELHQRRRPSHEAQHRAVDKITEALWPVHVLIEHADVRVPSAAEISKVMREFEWECQYWEPMLPTGARHLRVSIRQALANCFGSPAAIAVDPAADSAPTKTFDRYWWGLACTYVEHAQKRLGAWKVQERRRPLEIAYFANWRKEGDALHNRDHAGKLK